MFTSLPHLPTSFKKAFHATGVLLLLLFGCNKNEGLSREPVPPVVSDTLPFITYTIGQGEQYCDKSVFAAVSYSELKFQVKFDSSAIYKSADPQNQNDINKLFGFSDDSTAHQYYSARFGWRWSENALRLFTYDYNNGVRDSKELGIVEIGTINTCSIKVEQGRYIFSLNNSSDTLQRLATTVKGSGYKLYPYFGGDETAPHQIRIYIRESL